MFNLPNLSSKALLLSGASLAAILMTAPAHAATVGGMTGRTSAQINATMNPATNRPGGPLSPGAAAQQTSQSTTDFSTALARIQGQLSAQATARNAAAGGPNNLGADPNHPGQQLPDVPNGLGAGGLAPSANVNIDPSLWQNANAPTQAAANGQTTVTVQQTAQKAILTWDSFNVGKNTTVHFDQTGGAQSDGTNNWIALNRIVDPTDRPSQILGNIQAEGSVYLINNNGIIFGGSSQINVHTLIASSLSFLGENINGLTPGSAAYDNAVAASNSTYLTAGIAAPESTNAGGNTGNLVLGLGNQVTVVSPAAYQAPGDVIIQAGAGISTHVNGTQGDGGYILIAGTNVSNAGSVAADDGQVILGAGTGISFWPNFVAGSNALIARVTGQILTGSGTTTTDLTPISTLTNTGFVQATRGYITLLGSDVNQDGAVEVTTGVSYPGGITITAADELLTSTIANAPAYGRAGKLLFSPTAVTADLPEEDGETATSSPTTTFAPGSITITAGSAWFQTSSLLEAPGANISVAALIPNAGLANPMPGSSAIPGRILVDQGATIDVAGLANVEQPVSATLITIPLIGQNEIADAPNQAGLLGLTNVVLDGTTAGTTANGLAWIGTPILDAVGYAQGIPRSIDQLLTNAGTITLSADQVLTAAGSTLNLSGGYVHYLGGTINTTRLLDQNGLSTSIGNANPNDVYVGIAGVNTVDHSRWGITDSYTNSLIAGGYYQPDYIQGGNAGTLTVYGEDVAVLDGDMSAHALPGLKQVAAGLAPSGNPAGGNFLPVAGTFDFGDASALAYSNQNGVLTGEKGSLIIQDEAPQLSSFVPNFDITSAFNNAALTALNPNDPNDVLIWKTIPAEAIDAAGFANVTINPGRANGLVEADGATLSVVPGGSISMSSAIGGSVTILGSLIAPSGTISLSGAATQSSAGITGGSITVGPNAVLNTAGVWINDSDLLNAPGAATFVNGGSIALSASEEASITLAPGSVINVSSGGVMLAGGLLSNNDVPVGKGGSLSLIDYNFNGKPFGDTGDGGPALPNTMPTVGTIVLGGTVDSWGFAGGGTLTLQGLGFQIGGDSAHSPSWDITLPEDFLAKQGFGNYQLNAMYNIDVAPDTTVRVTQQNLIPNIAALAAAPSGSNINAGGLTTLGTLDPYHRQATNLILAAGGDLSWSSTNGGRPTFSGITNAVTVGVGATIQADAGSAIGLGSPGQVTVLGTIIAPGGSITLNADSFDNYTIVGAGADDFTSASKSVWLGANAVLDVAGTTLINPFAPQVLVQGIFQTPVTGKVLDGGSVLLSDDTGYLVAQSGSTINVSGTSAVFDELQSGAANRIVGQSYSPQTVWSNAGSITLRTAGGLLFDGSLEAQSGAAGAEGGTLTILPQISGTTVHTATSAGVPPVSAMDLILQQSGELVPTGLMPGQALSSANQSSLIFSADRLDGSGIATLNLGNGTGIFASSGSAVPNPVIGFAGNVTLALANAVVINAAEVVALPAGAVSIPHLVAGATSVGSTTVSISAPYVEITGPAYGSGAAPALTTVGAADGTLNVSASFVDLENQVALANFGQTNITSSGDIRLSSIGLANSNKSLAPGILYTTGNLTLKAADIYPASGETFVLDAKGPQPTTITFESNGTSDVPLSAGGSLLVDADNIVQSGTLRAPIGSIVLGVGDPTNTATQTAFDNLPLAATKSVSLTSGSLISVSADGATLPYGTTTDGTEWDYNSIPNLSSADLTAPPAKSVSLNGAAVSLNQGGTIDLSGGGTLQAEEWVPGTGGSRDLLSRYNVSYASSSTGAEIPLYADARNVYAVVPGYSAPVAAYDPVFAQQNPTTASGQVTSLGVGQAGTGDSVGKAVYLSGVPGLPAGVYTLLPAKYATLPGAFRVVQNTGASNIVPGQNTTLADGTHVVTGYYEDALNGSRSAMPSQFEVQSAAVWGKYSQYNLTTADTFFAAQAASAGTPTPALPMDAGQLVLAATNSLTLGATLNTAPAQGGASAEVDIASQDIQIVGSGEAALAGYLQLSASQLDALNAGSLLIGGTRTRTTTGVTILADANSIVVSNDASNPLTGPEIILVTKTDTTGTDRNATNGLRLDPGSVITATGTMPAGAGLPITIGSTTVSGDGSLVRVSQGAQVTITRVNVPANPLGSLTVGAGATVNGGAALLLDSSGALNFDPAAVFSGTDIAVDAPKITITDGNGAGLTGFVVGPNSLAQFANSKQVDLRSYGDLAFNGNLSLNFGENVDFSAGAFTSDGDTITVAAPTVAFTNDLNAPSDPATPGQGSLIVDATEIDFGSGSKNLKGFSSVAMTATGGIVGQDTGSFDMGSANVTLAAPIYVADTGSGTSLTTTGSLALNSDNGRALTITPVGGAISFTAGSIADNGATIEAPAGNVSLETTSGDLTIASGSLVSSAGVSKQFYDTTEYAPGGAITLTADQGNVNIASGSTLDFSGANGGGAAGSLTISAPVLVATLNGTIKGNAASGNAGGSFSLDTGGAVDLDNLATELAASGVNTLIFVQSGAGNLALSQGNTLTAKTVSLTANGGPGGQSSTDGNVQILGTINASGIAGGQIGLYGKSSVDVEGSLIASASDPSQRGGTVSIDTTGTPGAVVAVNGVYGYETITAANSGAITVGANAVIDVTGGTASPLLAGTVNFRAPLLDTGDVNLTIASGAQIKGSRATTLEAYAVWSTDDPLAVTNGAAKHFDGIIDPAGWYDANGNLLPGTFTTPAGATFSSVGLTQAQITADLTNDYFMPTAANTDASRTAHETFYGYVNGDTTAATAGTLMGFIQNGLGATPVFAARFSGIANFQAAPGVELDNPSATVNGGNISILTNWNLGAGQPNNNGSINPAFRYQTTIAPIVTLRAVSDVMADASITDGFYQNQAATILGGTAPVGSGSTYGAALQDFNSFASEAASFPTLQITFTSGPSQLVTALNSAVGADAELAAPLMQQSGDYYTDYISYATAWNTYYQYLATTTLGQINGHILPVKPFTRTPTGGPIPVLTATNAATYYGAVTTSGSYLNIFNGLVRADAFNMGTAPPVTLATDVTEYPAYIATYNTYLNTVANNLTPVLGAPVGQPKSAINFFYAPDEPLSIPAVGSNIGNLPGNAPSNVPTKNNPLPIAFAILSGGESASYRIVAGADFSNVDPVALQPLATIQAGGGGSVTLNDHTSFLDSNNQTLLDPATIRTGSGFINIAAANDVSLLDTAAPGVIYAAGVPASGAPTVANPSIANGALVTQQVNPDAAGDVSVHAQNDITGIETTTVGSAPISQFWGAWMESGNAVSGGRTTQTSINFDAFDQGIMSVGGNISISAGGDITNLAVSAPTTWYLSNNNTVVNTVGGGNLSVTAGGDILSGDYFVAQGVGTLTAGGKIGSSGLTYRNRSIASFITEVSTLLGIQDGVFNISARQGVDIGAVVNPSYIRGGDSQSYSPSSALNVISTAGAVALNTLEDLNLIGAAEPGTSSNDSSEILPATVNLTAFTGGITVAREGELYPSATGELSLIADQAIDIYTGSVFGTQNPIQDFGLIDASASALPSPLNPMPVTVVGVTNQFDGQLASGALIDHTPAPLHANDTQPVKIYSLQGSITDGFLETTGGNAGLYDKSLTIALDKPAQVYAGTDIVNLNFLGENLTEDNVTRIIAGRDIVDTNQAIALASLDLATLNLAGPGTFDVEAGRNISLFNPLELTSINPYAEASTSSIPANGIVAIGNAANPYLPHESANIEVLFGVGPGVANASFISAYVDPTVALPDVQQGLVAFMEQYDEGAGPDTGLLKDTSVVTLTLDQAWAQFQALPSSVQQIFNQSALFTVLTDVDMAYNDPTSPFFHQYARGYQAINTLFPASSGYTSNSLEGGVQGANALVSTGNLDIRSNTIQTQQGGNVTILGPGGQALVGAASAPPAFLNIRNSIAAGPSNMGILTLETGNIDVFTDKSLLLAQSRVFTEQGGDMTIWSSNGDINAGKGAKTSADTPAPIYVCSDDFYCTRDARGEVTGAGIATLQTIPGAPAGNVFLIAPRGTVDAGAAGIRVSGDLFVAALAVANANNIQVQGKSVGLPPQPVTNLTLTTASTAATEAALITNGLKAQQPQTTVDVEVTGFGGDDNSCAGGGARNAECPR